MVKPEAFIAIESSLSLRLSSTFTAITSDLFAAVQDAIDAKEWDVCERLIRGVNLEDVFLLNRDYISYLSKVAVLFGASRVTGTPGTTAVGLGFENQGVSAFIESFRLSIQYNLQESLIESGLQLIAQARALAEPAPESFSLQMKAEGSYLGRVLKAGKPTALLPFQSFMDKSGKSLFKMGSSLHTSRLSAFGFTAEAGYLGITEYQITEQLDGRTCPVCSLMHGKTFQVSDARSLLDTVIRTQDPDELKQLQPWPSQSASAIEEMSGMSAKDLVSRGWHIPPFHPRCRGLLTRTKTAPKLTAGQTAPSEVQPYVSTKEDFAQLGIKLSPAKVDLWNKLLQTSPTELIAQLTGGTEDSLLAKVLQASDPQSSLGLASLKVTSNGVALELQNQAFGAKHLVTQSYYFRKNQDLFVGSIKLNSEDVSLGSTILRSLYGAAKKTSMKSMSAVADGELGGYAWAKYGFSLTPNQWSLLKSQIKSSAEKTALILNASALEQKALAYILRSTNPKDVFALADLPTLGRPLLSGTSWMAKLDFEDPESVARFMSMMGGAG